MGAGETKQTVAHLKTYGPGWTNTVRRSEVYAVPRHDLADEWEGKLRGHQRQWSSMSIPVLAGQWDDEV